MTYVFTYHTLVNREYNIYKEIIFNPFLFSYIDIFDPSTIKDLVTYTKDKKVNILENVLIGEEIDIYNYIVINKVLLDNGFYENEEFNLYSNYVDELLFSEKVKNVIILVNDLDEGIEDMEVNNVVRRFKNNRKLQVIKTKSSLVSEDLKELSWDCISVRDIEQVIDIVVNNDIENKDIIIEEIPHNKLDPVNYILLQEKNGRIDYRAMI